MKNKKMTLSFSKTLSAVILVAALTGCAPVTYYEVPVPAVDIGSPRDGSWRPYPVREGRVLPGPSQRVIPTDQNYARPLPRSAPVYREDLTNPSLSPSPQIAAERGMPPASSSQAVNDRVKPVDPPKDWGGRKRTYSSRPEQNAKPDRGSRDMTANPSDVTVRSPWADKAVRKDNRGNFDQMAKEAARHGKGRFEDEAGRKYFGESIRDENGCKIISVTVTGEEDMPIAGSGIAYVCR